ncbi:MAG: adenosylcobinamide-GDP ribazoletransferase [Pseudomonadota bacterium]
MKRLATNELAVFALAVQFLTRIPVPVGNAFSPARLAATPRYYPLVGVIIGVLCAAVHSLALACLSPAVAILLAVGAGLLITGGFHEDGLADTFDGLGGADRDQTLEIMRDSRIGTYGTLALVLILGTKIAALVDLAPGRVAMAFIVAHSLSRLSAVLVIASSRYVRDHGIGKPTADGIGVGSLAVALLTGALLLVWFAFAAGTAETLTVLAGALLGHVAMRALFERRLGGYTGDTLGAVQQTSELGVYLGLLSWQ